MLTRWQGWLAAATVTLAAGALVLLDGTDTGLRHWWAAHALTTDTVSGVLVLLVTVLVVDQLVRRSQVRDRSRAVAAQAAIMLGQAVRSARAVSAALAGDGDRDAAADEVRTYMIMLLVGAPVLIDARQARSFLEQAQRLGGVLAAALGTIARAPGGAGPPGAGLDDAVQRVRAAAAPLIQTLGAAERAATAGQPQ